MQILVDTSVIKDEQIFILSPEKRKGSPLDVEGVDTDLTAEEIVQFIHEGRPCQI